MRPTLLALAVAAAASALGGCSTTHPAGVAQSPNPPAPPGYRVVCDSRPTILNGFNTSCEPVRGRAVEERVVVRAKG